jgi:peptidoglycan DL-endopeptidase CwlO
VASARSSFWRPAATGLALAAVIIFGTSVSAAASPKPDIKAVQKKLRELTTQVDTLTQQYDKTVEDLTKAQRQLAVTNQQVADEQKTYDRLHAAVAQMAAAAYKNGGGDGTGILGSVVSAKDPAALLNQISVITAVSKNRGSTLAQFVSAAALLTRAKDAQQGVVNDIKQKQASIKQQTAELKKQVAQQKKLLAEAGGPVPGQGSCDVQASGKALTAIQFACSKLGTPYEWGGTGPRYDCSGLTQAAWDAAGISLPRTTWEQWAYGSHLSYDQLQPGDLVFFEASLGHMGMYLGGGKMIHAPHTGDVVKISDISSGYYRSQFQGGVRPY